MGEKSNHDDMLFEMLKECKTLPIFLSEIFGFLQRRTDFYHVAADESSPVGLPEGLAEKLVRHSFYKCKPLEKTVACDEEIPVTNEEIVVENKENDDLTCITSTLKNLTVTNSGKNLEVFTGSDSYNGAVFDTYSWSQNIQDIDVIVQIPSDVTSKDLLVTILPKKLSIKLRSGQIILEGDLCQKCKSQEAIWSLDKRKLEIHLDKCQDRWWDCLIQSEPKLDISKIDCTRPFEDLPEEAQAKIEELQWNQEQKRLGLPTSEEIDMQKTLRKAWDVEGSPFSGPFDPSSVVFN